jgi:hypothetical protein
MGLAQRKRLGAVKRGTAAASGKAKRGAAAGKAAAASGKAAAAAAAGSGSKAKRRFSSRVTYERAVIKAAKHGFEQNSLIETSRARRSMLAHLASDTRLSPRAVDLAKTVVESLLQQIAQRAAVLLHYADKRKADEKTMQLAAQDVLRSFGHFGDDVASNPHFLYRSGLPAYIPCKGRTSAKDLAEQFAAGNTE